MREGRIWWVATIVILLGGLSSAALSQEVTVPGTASGGFDFIDTVGSTAGQLVPGFTFSAPNTVVISAGGGPISLEPTDQIVSPGPDGTFCVAEDGGLCTCSFPLELAISEAPGGPTIPRTPPHDDVGALMGAFVPEEVITPGPFFPFDEDRLPPSEAGIPSTDLFLIGSGPFEFSAPGPGTLFLGINDCFASNNVGSYSVTFLDQLTVNIDIKPGSFPNSINLSSAGVIPVAILSSDTFDATTVDPDTVTLAGASVKLVGKGERALAHAEDVNWDGLLDLVCQVVTEQVLLEPGESIAVLEATTFDGVNIRGEDTVNIVQD